MTPVAVEPSWMTAHDDRALAFEKAAEDETSAALRLLVADAARRLAAEYVKLAGGVKIPLPAAAQDALRAAVKRIVAGLASGMLTEVPRIIDTLEEIATGGMRLGARANPQRQGRRHRARLSRDVAAAIAAVRRRFTADVETLRHAAAGPIGTYRDVTTIAGRAAQVVDHVAASTRWIANRTVNDGAAQVADADHVARLWVAERNACLTCLAYAGELAAPGEPFPAGLSFGTTSTVQAALYGPPAHPNCRCRIQPWYGQDEPFGIPLPQALQREARRSVLSGASDFASRPAKLAAADRLLKTALVGLPDTVKLRAAVNVRAGVGAWRPAKRAPSGP